MGLVVLLCLSACNTSPTGLSIVQSGPTIEVESRRPVSMSSADFNPLWDASDKVLRELHFQPARRDKRLGVMTTEPMTSAQWFEPWRRELRTRDAAIESSLATLRRTVTINFVKQGDEYRATPSVLVERFALVEKRITSVSSYRGAFGRNPARGSAEADSGVELPATYWYPVGTDPDLEQYIARQLAAKMR